MPRFFKKSTLENKLERLRQSEEGGSTTINASGFSESNLVRDLLGWIHSILDCKNEPSLEIKQLLQAAFATLKQSMLSSASIAKLTRRLQTENTPAAKAVAAAHGKINKLSFMFSETKSEKIHLDYSTQRLFKPTPYSQRTHDSAPRNVSAKEISYRK